jgi:hypothetical protein
MASNLDKSLPEIPQAKIDNGLEYENMSPMGKKLYDLARLIELSDEPENGEAVISRELKERQGGHSHNDEDPHVH